MASQTRKIKQDELRRLMNEHKRKLIHNVKKVESPLARYDKDGSLNCIICQTIVRSEAVWNIHLNSKKHKENLAQKVKKKEEPQESEEKNVPIKRPAPSTLPVNAKRVKSILKNAPTTPNYSVPVNSFDDMPEKQTDSIISEYQNSDNLIKSNELLETHTSNDVLPEGFFDDPKLDAKVRNVEYKDPIEEEWEQFQKQIREETSKAQQIIAEDQEEATTERQIDEIDEQIRNWNRVVSLERKKQEVIGLPAPPVQTLHEDESSEDEDDFEEFLDWRSKKSF